VRKLAARAQKRAEFTQPVGPALRPYQVVLRPLVTEKSTHSSTRSERRGDDERPRRDAYTFKVALHSTKLQNKKAVEELFGVRVVKVRTKLHMGKKRRYKFRMGQMPNWKKAIVTLHEEDRIEFF
jgi:large subunit ribosomal protein L23